MLAAVLTMHDTPWELQERPIPIPSRGQVLIKIHASGLCFTDVHQTHKLQNHYPRVLGHEPVGEIIQIGEGVRTRRVGDRVGVPWTQVGCGRCEFCQKEQPAECLDSVATGVTIDGGHAEYMLAFEAGTVLLPDGLSYEQAAPILCAGYTVWSGIKLSRPQIGERIGVVGIGGLGHLAIQYVKAAGFETVAIAKSINKHEFVKSLGADHTVGNGTELKALGGVDILLCTSNSYESTVDAIQGMRPNGRVMIMGIDQNPLALTWRLIAAQIRVIAVQQGPRRDLIEALGYAAKGRVKAVVEKFSLREIGTAFERVQEGSVRYRAVIGF